MIGAVVSAAGSIYSGMSQGAAYDAQAKAKIYEQRGISQQGAYESNIQDIKNKQLTGQQVTAIAASGVDIWGTPSDVVASSRSAGELDKQAIRYGSQYRANIAGYESEIATMNAGQARIGGIIGAVAPLISGFTSARTSFG